MADNQPANQEEKAQPAAGPMHDQPAEGPAEDPAKERLYESPLPFGEGVPFDPELYQPPLTPEELEELREEDEDDD
jgi:hypothetical protein